MQNVQIKNEGAIIADTLVAGSGTNENDVNGVLLKSDGTILSNNPNEWLVSIKDGHIEVVKEGDACPTGLGSGDIFASGNIIAGNTLKGLNLEISSDITASKFKTFDADEPGVGGINISGDFNARNINASGDIENSGSITTTNIISSGNITSGNISSSGTISSTGDINTSGNLKVSNGVTIDGSLSVGGSFSLNDLECGQIQVEESIVCNGNINCSENITCSGTIIADKVLAAYKEAYLIENHIRASEILIGGDIPAEVSSGVFGNFTLSNAKPKGIIFEQINPSQPNDYSVSQKWKVYKGPNPGNLIIDNCPTALEIDETKVKFNSIFENEGIINSKLAMEINPLQIFSGFDFNEAIPLLKFGLPGFTISEELWKETKMSVKMSPVTGFNIKHDISEDFVIDANILNNNWLSSTERGEVGFSMGFNTGNRKNNQIVTDDSNLHLSVNYMWPSIDCRFVYEGPSSNLLTFGNN